MNPKEWFQAFIGALQAKYECCYYCKFHDHPNYIFDENDSEWIFDEVWCKNPIKCLNADQFKDIPTIDEILKKPNISDEERRFFEHEIVKFK